MNWIKFMWKIKLKKKKYKNFIQILTKYIVNCKKKK